MKKILLFIAVLFCSAQILVAQERTVTGTVTSAEDGEPLPGVNVVIKGTSTGTITDGDGKYNVATPSDDAVLRFTFIGLLTQEVSVGNRSSIDVKMKPDARQIEELVITGSAVGQSEKKLSFAVGKIDEELLQEAPAPNVATGLQGKVSGLRVNTGGGQPGRGANFQIRAANSLTTGQQPLIIVDGVFLNGSTLADINSEDIERVEVLKGSAGASLYGSQAANGVIQIFTKRGKGLEEGVTRITYRTEIGASALANNRFPTADTHHYELDPNGNFKFDGTGARVLAADGLQDNPYPNYQDYQDQFFRNGDFSSHSISVQGRGKDTNFGASAQTLTDEGILEGVDGYRRNAFRVNVDHRINRKLDMSISSSYSTSEQDRVPSNGTGALINNILFYPPFYDLNLPNEEDGTPFNWDIDSLGSTIRNPWYTLTNRKTTQRRTRLIGGIKGNYDLNDKFSFNASVALDRSVNRFQEFINKGFLSNDLRAGVQFVQGGDGAGGGLEESSRIRNSLISRVNAVYQEKFGDLNLAARLSYLYEDLDDAFVSARGDDLSVSGIRSFDNITNNASIRLQSEQQKIVSNSFFIITDLDYQDKYIFSGLIRREGSSLFGPENRWATYYRLSAAYRLTEDIEIPKVEELKFRASVGTAGIRPTFEQRFETFTLRNGNATKNTLGNNLLEPANSREIELGINASFLDRFTFEFNWVQALTQNQILRVPQPAAAGFSAQWRNAGTVDARVIEFALNTEIVNTDDFSWNFRVNFDKTRQIIDELNVPAYNTGPGNQSSTIFRIEEGVSFGTMNGEVFATSLDEVADREGSFVINKAGFVVESQFLGTPDEVPIKLEDDAGNPLVRKIGDINPDFRMGFANTLSYKNITLYTLFDWKNGGDIYNQSRAWLHRDLLHQEASELPIAVDFWNNLYNVNVPSNAFVEDGSFFMLRELALSYRFNKEQLANFLGGAVHGVKIGFVARNLFTFTDYSGFHPDITSSPRDENQLSNRVAGGAGSDANTPNGDPSVFYFDSFVYPQTKTFAGSIQITF